VAHFLRRWPAGPKLSTWAEPAFGCLRMDRRIKFDDDSANEFNASAFVTFVVIVELDSTIHALKSSTPVRPDEPVSP
jgi:hypothetical protein